MEELVLSIEKRKFLVHNTSYLLLNYGKAAEFQP